MRKKFKKELYKVYKKGLEIMENKKNNIVTINKEINELVVKYLKVMEIADEKDLYIEIYPDTDEALEFIYCLYDQLLIKNDRIRLHKGENNPRPIIENTFTMRTSDYEFFFNKFRELKNTSKGMFSGIIRYDLVFPSLNKDIPLKHIEHAGMFKCYLNSRNLGLASMHFWQNEVLNPESDILSPEKLKLNINKAFFELFKNHNKDKDSLLKKCDHIYKDEDPDFDNKEINIKNEVCLFEKLCYNEEKV